MTKRKQGDVGNDRKDQEDTVEMESTNNIQEKLTTAWSKVGKEEAEEKSRRRAEGIEERDGGLEDAEKKKNHGDE